MSPRQGTTRPRILGFAMEFMQNAPEFFDVYLNSSHDWLPQDALEEFLVRVEKYRVNPRDQYRPGLHYDHEWGERDRAIAKGLTAQTFSRSVIYAEGELTRRRKGHDQAVGRSVALDRVVLTSRQLALAREGPELAESLRQRYEAEQAELAKIPIPVVAPLDTTFELMRVFGVRREARLMACKMVAAAMVASGYVSDHQVALLECAKKKMDAIAESLRKSLGQKMPELKHHEQRLSELEDMFS